MAKSRLIPRKFLSSDEQVVFETRPSAWLHMKAAVLGVIVFLLGIGLYFWNYYWNKVGNLPEIPYLTEQLNHADYGTYLQYALLVIAGISLLYVMGKYLKWSSTVYAATDERIITQRGILNKTYEDIPLDMITNIDLSQSLGKRALGYGTMVFSTQGLGGRKADIVWEAVPNPMTVRRRLQEVMDTRPKSRQR